MADGNGNGSGDAGNAGGQAGGTGTPWFQGLQGVDNELIGHMQNRGWHDKPASEVALAAIRAHREAEGRLGVPADQLLRLPAKQDAPEWNGVWERLGRPKEATEYDFASVKFKDGSDLDDPFVDFMRERAFKLNLPKTAAVEMARGLVEYMDGAEARDAGETTAKIAEERTALARDWGTIPDKLAQSPHMLIAQNAVRALGIDPEAVNALEGQVGYAKVMQMFSNIGRKIGEDRYVTSNASPGNGLMTREQAEARKGELKNDKGWVTKFLNGDSEARREMTNLDKIIAGAAG